MVVSHQSIHKRRGCSSRIRRGYYQNNRETHWILEDGEKVGVIFIHDINDTIPLFDLRLDANVRGKGYGVKALHWLQEYLFGERGKIRIEG